MKKLLALSALILLNLPTLAASVSGSITVKAQVVDSCTVTGAGAGASGANTTADFGVYQPALGNLLGTGGAGLDLSVKCALGTLYSVSLDSGLYNSAGVRRMAHATSSTDFLTYTLGLLDVNGVVQDATGVGLPYVGTGLAVPLVLRGTIPANQNARIGNYQDTVVLKITY